MNRSTTLNRTDWILLAAIALLTIGARWLPGPRTIDDAFITFRYARNLVEGQGFVYNPDSHVLGTTTPLFTLVMAAISTITRGQDFPYYAIAVSSLADAVTAILLALLARRISENRWLGVLLGMLWAVAPQSATFAVGGMETSVVILWMVLSFWLFLNERPVLLGIVAGLGILTRVDAGLWVALLLAYQLGETLYHTRRENKPLLAAISIPLRTWIACGVTMLPWLAFSTFYFGSPFPNTIGAKTVAYVLQPGAAIVTFIQVYSTPFFEFNTFGENGAKAGSVIYLLLSLIGIAFVRRKTPRLLPLLAYPWIYFAIFAIANPLVFRWYLAPPMPGLFLSILAGAYTLLEGLQRRMRTRPVIQTALALLAVLWIGTSLNGWTLHPDHGADRPAPRMAWHQIELYYQQVATQLREQYGVTPQTRVASADIGAVGYFSRATIIDTVGLVTPTLSKYYPVDRALIVTEENQNYAIPPQLILDTQPAYFVAMEAFVRKGLEKNAAFKTEYGDPILLIPTGFYGKDMRVYQRKSP